MAKSRKGRVPPHLKKYLFKKKRRGKRRSKRRARKSRRARRTTTKRTRRTRRSTTMARRKKGRRRGGRRGGGGFSWKPSSDDLKLFAGAGIYGFLEKQAKADKEHMLNQVPKPVAQLGFTGNIALLLWGVGVVGKSKWARLGARSVATVASYQLGRRGELYKEGSDHFTVAGGGWSDEDVANAIEAGAQVGALDPMGVQGY